jgi:hypothetical protein
MRPPEKFWNRYLAEIDRLESEGKVSNRDHEVLRFALNAPDELMEVTRGDVEGINERNLHLVLEKLEQSFAAEKEEEIRRERIEHEKTRAVLESQIELDAARAEYEHRETKEALARAQATIAAREEHSRDRLQRIATAIANGAFYLSGIGFAVVGALALFGNISPFLGIPSAIVGFFNLWTGFSGNVVKRVVRTWIERRLTRLFGQTLP